MWCPQCQSDVAAEFTVDDRRLLCARCGEVLAISPVPRRPLPLNAGTALDAAALLARWSAEETLLDPRTELKTSIASGNEFENHESPDETLSDRTVDDFSEDGDLAASNLFHRESESGSRFSSFPPIAPVPSSIDHSFRIVPLADQPAKDQPSVPSLSRPSRKQPPAVERTNWVFVVGQMAAYLGVFVLTCGTAMVVTSMVRGESQETQSGWLLATIGQMLLFLGVVTIISSGLEQTRSEFRRELRRLRKVMTPSRNAPATSDRHNRPAA